jgi:hypothetical protein
VFTGGSHFGGQHDARRMADGSITLFDDGTGVGRAPRAVRYTIDTNARTATLVETSTDPNVAATICCGSAREVYPGVWVIGWGGSGAGLSTESVASLRQFTINFPNAIIYRSIPLTTSQVSVAQLDQAMDARFANPAASADATGSPDQMPFPP